MSDAEIIRYNFVARALHWLMASLLILNLLGGLFHEHFKDMPTAMPIHKSLGLTILALAVTRLVWRLTHKVPPLPEMPGWERTLARLGVWAFYALMILVPLSGWVMASAGKYPLNWFWVFDVPKFAVEKGDALAGVAHEGHELLAFALIPLILIHIAAALRHHFILKNDVLRRMLGR